MQRLRPDTLEAVATLKSVKPKFTTRLIDDEDEAMGEKIVNPSTMLGSAMRKPPADKNCTWTRIQVPYAIQAYNQRMGGVDDEDGRC